MRFKYKIQDYQTDAVNAVCDIFDGLKYNNGDNFQIDPGFSKMAQIRIEQLQEDYYLGIKNQTIDLEQEQLLDNLHNVQQRNDIDLNDDIVKDSDVGCLALDVVMETGTGKTYVYIKTMYELNKKYGFSKFIVVVPSIAIREGVYKTFQTTESHFKEQYNKAIRFFIYDSKDLTKIDDFARGSEIQCMIINMQAFNSSDRVISTETEAFQSRTPLKVIASTRPIIVLDEPQKISGDKTKKKLKDFNPLFTLSYSATPRQTHNIVYRLDALDAYNKQLVKEINVKGFERKNTLSSDAYIYFDKLETDKDKAYAILELDFQTNDGSTKRKRCRVELDDDLKVKTNLDKYDGYVVKDIDLENSTLRFTNNVEIKVGQITSEDSDEFLRRLQIRYTIKAHLDREEKLFSKGIKVLSLFFIDEVKNYREYTLDGTPTLGRYGKIFEEEYKACLNDKLDELTQKLTRNQPYIDYLNSIDVSKTHNGYFAEDKNHHFIDSKVKKGKEIADSLEDISAYDLILKNKERLLSFDEPVRFIFSHSALSEGWDNPNVFQICTLKHTSSDIRRHQEVGRGLRLCVNQSGDRIDSTIPDIKVHDINKLTFITDESYYQFVFGLQSTVNETLRDRPNRVSVDFLRKVKIKSADGSVSNLTDEEINNIHYTFTMKGYINRDNSLTNEGKEAIKNRTALSLKDIPDANRLKDVNNAMLIFVNDNDYAHTIKNVDKAQYNVKVNNKQMEKFMPLWNAIKNKYRMDYSIDTNHLIKTAVDRINKDGISGIKFETIIVKGGVQKKNLEKIDYQNKEAFKENYIQYEENKNSHAFDSIKKDLIGEIANKTFLKRDTVCKILSSIRDDIFKKYSANPEKFINAITKIINQAITDEAMIDGNLNYVKTDLQYNDELLQPTSDIKEYDPNKTMESEKSIQNYLFIDGSGEKSPEMKFAKNCENSPIVEVYTKLPDVYQIQTPKSNYNPDWAIVINQNNKKKLFFIVETKGTIEDEQLRMIESEKIKSATKLYTLINEEYQNNLSYEQVDTYEKLLERIQKIYGE